MALGFKSGDCTYKLNLCEEHKFDVLNQLIIVYSYGWFSRQSRFMTKSFEQPSYLAEVRRLKFWLVKLPNFIRLRLKHLSLLNTASMPYLKITDTQNKQYILRINPIEHHTHQLF